MRKMTERFQRGGVRAFPFALTLGLVLVLGQLGAITHEYVHLGDLTPDLACHHCVAGDAKSPITAHFPPPDILHQSSFDLRLAGPAQVTSKSLPGHPVRAPPAFT